MSDVTQEDILKANVIFSILETYAGGERSRQNLLSALDKVDGEVIKDKDKGIWFTVLSNELQEMTVGQFLAALEQSDYWDEWMDGNRYSSMC